MFPSHQEMKQLISNCLDELMEHLMQDAVNSIHIKNLKNNLSTMRTLLDKDSVAPENNTPNVMLSPKKKVRRGTNISDSRENILKMAFALSKYDYHFFNNMFGIHLNQGSTFKMVAAFFDIKPSTLRNYRDAFDSRVQQVNSNRTGWVSEKFPPYFQEILDVCNAMTEEELAAEIRTILDVKITDIDLVTKIAFAFLGSAKATRATSSVTLHGQQFELIIAPYSDRVAYMVFISFGNALAKGIYPAIYVYRKFGKALTVFGESETSAPSNSWNIEQETYPKIRDYFSPDEIAEINKYANNYLDNRAYRVYDVEPDSFGDSVYMLELGQEIACDLKNLIDMYVGHYSAT